VSDAVADAAAESHTTCPPLPKSLGRRDVFLFLLCTLVGLDTLGSVAAHGGQGFLWLVFLAIFFFVPYALCIAELGSTFPEEGGVYVWTRLALGRPVAALTAVFYWVSNPIYLGGALTTTAMATWSTFFFELGSFGKVVFGLLLIWGCVLATVISLRYARWISAFGAGARIVILTLFTFSVALYAYVHGIHGIRVPELAPTMDGFAAVVPLLVFNFVGFELPSSAAGEMVDAQRDVPRAIMRSGVASVLCYGIPILAIVLVLPTDKITGLKGFVDAMQLVFTVYGGHVSRAPDGTEIVVLEGAGKVLGSVAALGFIVALATSGVAWIIGADRTQAIACLDGAGPRALGSFSNRWRTPVAVNIASGIIATLVMFSMFSIVGASSERFFAAVLGLGISTTTISYLGIFPALYLLRRKKAGTRRPYRIPGGDAAALLVTLLTFGWALFATVSLLWPGFGQSGNTDRALPAGFVTVDAHGMVVASQRALFELTQLVPVVFFVLVGVAFYLIGRREQLAARTPQPTPPPHSHPPSLRPAAG
jgi:glutamate:GABA antiporter